MTILNSIIMKNLIFGAIIFAFMGVMFVGCEKEEVKPLSNNDLKNQNDKDLNKYSPDDVQSILNAAGLGDFVSNNNEKTQEVIVVEGKWDGDMDSQDIGCLDGSICYIEIVALADPRIVIPDGDTPIVIDGRILPGEWETIDDFGVKTIHYPYEKN